jgi:LTXXQ motif family protein
MQNWPFDFIAQIVRPDDKQRSALDELRGTVKQAADSLMSNCPKDVPAAPTARFDAIEQAIDASIDGFNIVQPTLQTFYATLDDEQKARLLRDMTAGGTQDKTDRRNRWRSYASENRKGDVSQWASICEHLTAVLRGWPVREVERNVRLSETQRVAFYELVTASLKAADSLVNSCPSDTALTPVRRIDTMRKRLAAVREAAVSIRPTLVRFHEALDNAQKIRFAAMN